MSVIGDSRRTCGKFELFSLQTSFDEDNSSEENIFRDLVKLLMDSFLAVMVINILLLLSKKSIMARWKYH